MNEVEGNDESGGPGNGELATPWLGLPSESRNEPDDSDADVRTWLRVTLVAAVIGVALGLAGILLPENAQCEPSQLATTLVKGSELLLIGCCGSGIAGVIAGRGARVWFGLIAIGAPGAFLLLLAWHLASQPGTPACNWQL